ncbi:MAG: thioredoxin family protein [Planctomycetota bacterium]
MNAQYLKAKFDGALDWEAYLGTDPQKADNWRAVYEQVSLSPQQRRLVEGFVRDVKMLFVSGIWCGDCVQQGPLVQRIAEAGPPLDLRFVDRDEHLDLAEQIKINAGLRVPVTLFMAEDFEPVSLFGDRSLVRYRALARKQLAGACPLPGAPVADNEMQATLQDWLDEVERVHLILRLSARLREKHGD